uniref:ADP-ribosylglycohydrolase family protein n=1 Tax=Polynucleobacter sp. TaxID=2029855 RepID=UPI0040484755
AIRSKLSGRSGTLVESKENWDLNMTQALEMTQFPSSAEVKKVFQAVALAVFWARQGVRAEDIAARLAGRCGYPLHRTPDDIRPGYKRTERASDSVPQAISCALHAVSYEDAIRNAVSLGGDSDTIAAIAGGIAEAMFGIPDEIKTERSRQAPLPLHPRLQDKHHCQRIQLAVAQQAITQALPLFGL